MSLRTKVTVAFALLLSLILIGATQNQSSAFEVASVKRAPANRFVPPAVDPQRFRVTASLVDAIEWAYNVHNYQLSGGSPWMRREYYQIEGRAQAPATRKEMQAMLQGLLADRFKLKVHRERKDMSVYALIIGNTGPKLQTAKGPCAADGCIDVGPGEFLARYATMTSTAAILSNVVDRPVLDQTGLEGRYDFRMKFDPTLIKPYDGQPIVTPNPDSASIFSAIQELGLKLEPRRASVEILVIDNANEPSVN